MAEQEQLSVLIIGAGNKGALGPVSHAEAFSNNPAFKIAGFVDTNEANLDKACRKWGAPGFTNLKGALEVFDGVDVAVVSTPDEAQWRVITELIGQKARFIFAEKPFTQNSKDANTLLKELKAHDQTVMVNYTRRFIIDGVLDYGQLLGGSAFYTKGLHNLCHWVDTFLLLGIDPEAVEYIEIDRSKLNVFEAFLYFEEGRIEIKDFGKYFICTPTIEREDFPSEQIIRHWAWDSKEIDLDAAMSIAVQNIANHFLYETPLLQNANDAVKVLEICERLLK